ncbi:MAG: PTS sugar transporter subunit IIA [Candidatus Omnitrophota bacterium]
MLVIVMHNRNEYLVALAYFALKEGISNSKIVYQPNIGTRITGGTGGFVPRVGELRPVYDKALVTVLRDEGQLERFMKITEANELLVSLNMGDRGFICTVPFLSINDINFGSGKTRDDRKTGSIAAADIIRPDRIFLDMRADNKDKVIRDLTLRLKDANEINNFDEFVARVLEREKLSTTGIGNEVAIPHARTNAVKDLVMVLARYNDGVDFKSIDGLPVKLVFLIGTPNSAEKIKCYFKLLARISKLLADGSFREALLKAPDGGEIVGLFRGRERDLSLL